MSSSPASGGARVVRYRDDKTAAEADTIEMVRALGRPGDRSSQ